MSQKKLLGCVFGALALMFLMSGAAGAEEATFCAAPLMTSALAAPEIDGAETPEWLGPDLDAHSYQEKVNWCEICDAEPMCYSCCRCDRGTHSYCTNVCA